MGVAAKYVWWRGAKFNRASIASLVQAEKLSKVTFRIVQGGYNNGRVSASAGTHDGGGVVDISVRGWSLNTMKRVVKWLRRCGWAAWVRIPAQGFTWHIHAVRIGDRSASWGARAQVIAYRLGRNGLATNYRDTERREKYVTWEDSRWNPRNRPKPKKPNPLVINGRKYPGVHSVSVHWVNLSRRHGSFSRHTYIVERWLSRLGYNKDGRNNGRWSPGLQADLDAFRWKYRRRLGISTKEGAGGPVGILSLTLLRDKANSSRRVRRGR